ncbi:MAG TPA: tol-pal system protein YbgF [Xanthobacteraceae bacterium]|nr:tol-pal system protein YbgF [Xanthobacteraceae bacterium]
MTRRAAFKALALFAAVAAASVPAHAEDDSPFSLFGRMFKGSGPSASPPNEAVQESPRLIQNTPGDLVVRIERLEARIRELTGVIEQLQYRNQQLEAQIRHMQEASASQAPAPPARQSGAAPPVLGPPGATGSALPPPAASNTQPAIASGRRSDAFDPSLDPNAPGAPRTLGTLNIGAPPADLTQPPQQSGEPPIGAPGGRPAGAPLDLTTIGNQANLGAGAGDLGPPQSGELPPPPARPSSTGTVAAVLPPSAKPRDQYDLGYGYVLRKDYALAEDAFQTFLTKFPNDKLVPDAQFWLGESRFQRQRYDAAAEAFLVVSTKYTKSPKAPEAMLRLGQSLAALGQREMACATFAEVGRKFPRAPASVRQSVELEQKRVRC